MMKTLSLIGVLYAIFLAASADCPDGWATVWSDEFNGSKVDGTKWGFSIANKNGWGKNQLQYYTNRADNAFLSNGYLVLQANQENYQDSNYTSARMSTQNKFSTMYGKFEIRAKLPYGAGMWPGFWMLGEDATQVGTPACGEIDVMEAVGKFSDRVFGSIHATNYSGSGTYINKDGFSNDFHTYSVIWQPGSVQYLVDDQVYKTFTKADVGATWPFDGKKMFVLLTLAVGGNWPGSPDASTLWPQRFAVDYVRVYQPTSGIYS